MNGQKLGSEALRMRAPVEREALQPALDERHRGAPGRARRLELEPHDAAAAGDPDYPPVLEGLDQLRDVRVVLAEFEHDVDRLLAVVAREQSGQPGLPEIRRPPERVAVVQ